MTTQVTRIAGQPAGFDYTGRSLEMSLLRRFLIRAAQELGQNPKARAKASQVLEEDVKPRVKQAWREAQPKIENAKLGLKRFTQRVRDEYRKGRDGK